MEVTVGWSGEYARDKFQITMTEVDDLPSILIEAGLQPDVKAGLTNAQKFALLKVDAEIFSNQVAGEHGVITPQAFQEADAKFRGLREQYWTGLRNRYLPAPEQQPAP